MKEVSQEADVERLLLGFLLALAKENRVVIQAGELETARGGSSDVTTAVSQG